MKLCPVCHAPNHPVNRFCEQCGRPFAEDAVPGDATRRLTQSEADPAQGAPTQLSFDLSALFARKSRLLLGRASDCDIQLPHPTVSRYHALMERRPDGLWVRETNSVNGVWVGGRRVSETTLITDGSRIGIGPFLLTLSGGMLNTIDNSQGLRLEARALEKVIPLPGGRKRRLLDDINLVIAPGEFVTLLGPSGSGKSTLMDCLNGRRRATGGQVLANGADFYENFNHFRQSLGYVPQRDIVHTQLTVYRALYYTAQLRLPIDTAPAELRARLEYVIATMELGPDRDTLVGQLSGGQIKRVSLGAELLAEPALLYIDEATSGLDAGTEARMMRLFRALSDEGRSIICITHNVEHVDQCHLVLLLAQGKMVYYGPPAEAPRYFKVGRISEIYDQLAGREPGDWEQLFRNCSLYRDFVLERSSRVPAPEIRTHSGDTAVWKIGDSLSPPVPEEIKEKPQEEAPKIEPRLPAAPKLAHLLTDPRMLISMANLPLLGERFRQLTERSLRWLELIQPVLDAAHQFRVLTFRYLELIWSDRRGLRMLLAQAPIVAVFLLIGFLGKHYTEPMPHLRDLQPDERRMLTVFQGLLDLVDDTKPLPDPEKLEKLKLEVRVAGLPATVNGAQVIRLLRELQRSDLDEITRRTLEETTFTITIDGGEQSITGAELVHVLNEVRMSRIPELLLKVPGPVVPDATVENPRYTYILLFIVVMVVMWFGCNNAAKEIVKEEAIYARERSVNLGILPYLASKFLVLGVITALHALLLMLLVYGPMNLLVWFDPVHHTVPSPGHMLNYPAQYGVLVVLALTGVALGLLLSACVSNADRANALLPYVLIPQLILGGGVLAVDAGVLYLLATTLSPVYWAYRAVRLHADELPSSFPGAALHPDSVALPCVALGVQMVLLLLLTAGFMRAKDVRGK
jgi:ABC-type multidrug transport system ATPase subunit